MKTESMLVRCLAKMAITNDDRYREVLRNDCSHLLAELEEEENLSTVPHQPTNLMQIVTDTLREIGIPAHLKGYRHVREAIIMVINNRDLINAITGELYPAVAEKCNTTPSRVERAIRHAIEAGWDRGDMDILQEYFGNTISIDKGKPTNSEFIAMVAEHITVNM